MYKNEVEGRLGHLTVTVNLKWYKKLWYRINPNAFKRYVQHVKDLGNPIHSVDYDNFDIILTSKEL